MRYKSTRLPDGMAYCKRQDSHMVFVCGFFFCADARLRDVKPCAARIGRAGAYGARHGLRLITRMRRGGSLAAYRPVTTRTMSAIDEQGQNRRNMRLS